MWEVAKLPPVGIAAHSETVSLGRKRACLKVARPRAESILGKLAAGETVEQVLEAHPRLNEDAVRAALAFAADALRADVIYPLETIPR
jgi:uncharacterized protein (DUF433 family)